MKDSSNQNWKFGFGLLAGALAGYWLNSDHGRRVRSEIKDTAVEYGEKASEYVKDQVNAAGEAANHYYQQGVEAVQSAKSTFGNSAEAQIDKMADRAETMVEDAESGLKKGITKARKQLNGETEAIF